MSWRSRYGERFPDCAAIESIRANLDRAYRKQQEAGQEIRWLSDLLVRRSREMAETRWSMPDTDECDRCNRPVTRDTAGKWQHASLADALFCSLDMRASDRVAARKDDGNA